MSTEIVNNGYDRKLKNRPQLESWEEIVSQANICEPNVVELEDILSRSDISNAFIDVYKRQAMPPIARILKSRTRKSRPGSSSV